MFDNTSKLKVYSLGIVAFEKERDDDFIKVTPIESLSLTHDDLQLQELVAEVSLPDADGVVNSETMTRDGYIEAEWVAWSDSNRMTAPDVQPGETVLLFSFADTAKYYWANLKREPDIRRLETVRYAYGDIQEPDVEWDGESSYWVEVSTHDKHIKIHTSNSDGEPYVYDIVLDTAKGNLLIKDDIGNSIELDSPSSLVDITTNLKIKLKTELAVIDVPVLAVSGTVYIGGNLHVAGTITADSIVAAATHVSSVVEFPGEY